MKILFLTQSIYPLSGGRVLASFGYATAFNEEAEIAVCSPIRGSNTLMQETQAFCRERGLEAVLVPTTKRNDLFSLFLELPSRIRAWTTMTVPVYARFWRIIISSIKQERYDLIIVDHIGMAQYFQKIHRKFGKIPIIHNSHNVEFMNTEQELLRKAGNSAIKRFFARVRASERKKLEKYMIVNSRWTFCISNSDIGILANEFGARDKFVFSKPLIKFERIKTYGSLLTYNHKLLIVGSMNWYPNVQGILWFVDKVFRTLQQTDPEIKLYIVGNKPTEEIRALASESIIVTGFVESTRPYYEECDISIIPVFEGTGAKIKVLESLAAGIPTVCSTFAAKDYDGYHGMSVAENECDFIECISSLASNGARRQQMYVDSEKYYSQYFELNPVIKNILHGDKV